MPVLGFRDHWAMTCSLNLAGCRLRAESLARQLHSNLWSTSPRSTAQGSPVGSGSASPCFGLPPQALVERLAVVDRPPAKFRMSSLDDDEEEEELGSPEPVVELVRGGARVMPFSAAERVALLHRNGTEVYGNCKDASHSPPHVWRPDSPPESTASPDNSSSPALTAEMEEEEPTNPASATNASTPSTTNSTETVSELASPTFEIHDLTVDEGSPLAEELRCRLRLIQSQSQTKDATGPASHLEEDDADPPSHASTSSNASEASTSSRMDLLSPEPCPRLVRSTSLKTGKTPPGTPSRKKIVRFADALGLDLEAVRHFAKDDDAPIVPQSAFADLKIPTSSSAPLLLWAASATSPNVECQFVAQFPQPASDVRFLDRVRQQKVSLENIILNDLKVIGVVRVLNLGFEKAVRVRYSTTEWAAHTDLAADYVPNSCDGFSDKFTFQLNMPHLSPGQRLLFALRYVANGQEFWDNNNGSNYVLRCQAKAPQEQQDNGPRWLHHFM